MAEVSIANEMISYNLFDIYFGIAREEHLLNLLFFLIYYVTFAESFGFILCEGV